MSRPCTGGKNVRYFHTAAQADLGLRLGIGERYLRNRHNAKAASATIQLQLHYRPPYDWESVAEFFARHAITGVEFASPTSYQRNIAMPGRRRETRRALCHLCSGREDELEIEAVAALSGVGPWTVAMISLRGLGQPDIFPNKDLGLERAWARLTGGNIALQDHAENWRPWRSYAANLLWRSLSV